MFPPFLAVLLFMRLCPYDIHPGLAVAFWATVTVAQWAVLEEQARLGIKSAMTQFMSWNPWRMYVRATALGARGSFRMCSGGRGSSAAVRKRRLSVALGSGHRTTQYMKK